MRVIERIAGRVPASVVRLRSVDLRPLLKPIQAVRFESVDRISARELADLLRLPYVCQEGTQLTYCKGVYITDLRIAMSQAVPKR